MKRYFKLELDKCNFWQSEVKDGSKVYVKRDFKRRDEVPLNEVFFRQDIDGMFTEITTGKKMKSAVINNKSFLINSSILSCDTEKFASTSISFIV